MVGRCKLAENSRKVHRSEKAYLEKAITDKI